MNGEKKIPFDQWVASAQLLADHTWEVLQQNEEVDF